MSLCWLLWLGTKGCEHVTATTQILHVFPWFFFFLGHQVLTAEKEKHGKSLPCWDIELVGCCAGLGRRLHIPRVKATIGLIVTGPYFASALVLVETLSLFLSKQHLGFPQPCLAETVSRFIFIILKFNYVYGGRYVHLSAGARGVWKTLPISCSCNDRRLWTALWGAGN